MRIEQQYLSAVFLNSISLLSSTIFLLAQGKKTKKISVKTMSTE